MPTQIQPTPTLYGEDARRLLEQIEKKPTPEQIARAEKRREFFAQIRKRGD